MYDRKSKDRNVIVPGNLTQPQYKTEFSLVNEIECKGVFSVGWLLVTIILFIFFSFYCSDTKVLSEYI